MVEPVPCDEENVGSIPFGCCFFFYPVCSVLVSFEEVNIFLEKFGLTLVQLGAEKPFRKVWLISFSVVQIYNTENLGNLGILMLDFCLSC